MRHFITFKGLDDGNDITLDVSAICNSQNTSIMDARCTKTFTSASSTASFVIGYTPDKVADPYDGSIIDRDALYGQVVQYVLLAVEKKAEMQVVILDDTRTATVFAGMIDPSDINITRNYIPKTISISCRDYTTDLDKKIGLNIVYDNKSVNEIVNDLLDKVYGVAGGHNDIGDGTSHTGVYDAISVLADSKTVEYFVITADESTTFRKAIDTLLLETGPGCVLHYVHLTNRFEVVKAIPDEVDDTLLRTVAYKTEEGIQARTGVYAYDGILLKWPSVEVKESDNVYAQDIELQYTENGVIGAVLTNGAYYPADGDITPTRQEYRKGDYDFVTGVTRKQNNELGLLYAEDAGLGVLCEPVKMRSRGTVADMDALEALDDPRLGDYAKVTDIDEYRAYDGKGWVYTQAPSLSSDGKGDVYKDKGEVSTYGALPAGAQEGEYYKCLDTGMTWCRMDNEWQRKISLFLFPVLSTSDVDMVDGNPAFYPRSMWALGRNRSGGMVNLVTLSVTATSVARTKINSTTHPSVIKEPEEYSATYIFDSGEAESFALWLYNAHRIACTTVTWYEWEDQRVQRSVLGERVKVEFMPGRKAVFCVIQIDDTGITRLKRKYKVTALLVSGFESAFSGTHEVTVPSADNARQIVLTAETYAVSSSGSVTPSSWSDVRNPQQGKYLWTKTVTYFSDGTSETTYSNTYYPKDGEDADLTGYSYEIQYGLSISPVDFEFPPADYGYENGAETDTFGDSDDDDDAWGFLDAANWSGTYTHWVKGLYVWQRLKVTNRDGNVTYTDPSYCRDLTESLINGCVLEVVLTDSDGDGNTQTWEKNLASSQAVPIQFRLKSNAYPSVTALQSALSAGDGVSITLYKAETVIGTVVTPSPSSSGIDTNNGMVTLVYDFSIARNLDCDSIVINAGIRDSYVNEGGTSYNIDTKATETMTSVDATEYYAYAGTWQTEAEAELWFNQNCGGVIAGYSYVNSTSNTIQYYDGEAWDVLDIDLRDSGVVLSKVEKEFWELFENLDESQRTNLWDMYGYKKSILASTIATSTLRMYGQGIIVSKNVDPDPTQDIDVKGFLTKTGYRLEGEGGMIRSSGSMFNDAKAKNLQVFDLLNLQDENGDAQAEIIHPAISTASEVKGDPTGISFGATKTHWFMGDLMSLLNLSAGTYTRISSSSNINSSYKNRIARISASGNVLVAASSGSLPFSSRQAETYSFSIPEILVTKNITVSGTRKYFNTGSGLYGGVGGYSISVNGTVVASGASAQSMSSISFSESISVKSGDTVSVTLGIYSSTYTGYSGQGSASYNISAVTASDVGIGTAGLWMFYFSSGAVSDATRLVFDTYYEQSSTSVVIVPESGYPVISSTFYSSSYKVYCKVPELIGYTSYYDSDSQLHTIEQGVSYRATGSVSYNGNSYTVSFFIRNSSSQVQILFSNGSSTTLNSSGYYNISGSLAIAGSAAGVQMMGQYPKTDMTYDIGTPTKRWLTGYISSLPLTSKRSEKKDIVPFDRKALDVLKNVEIVRYVFKKDPNNTPLIGFIADDTDSDLSGVNHDSMMVNSCIGILIKAVQELAAEIDRLKGGKS